MNLFTESGMRGGLSVITHRHAKANKPSMSSYIPTQPSSYLVYLDLNNIHGAMSQPPPTDGLKI